MRDLIKKSLLIGLGAASLTKEKIDEIMDEFVKKKAITTKDGKMLAREVLKELARGRKRLENLGRLESGLRKKAKGLEKRGRKTAKSILASAQKELE